MCFERPCGPPSPIICEEARTLVGAQAIAVIPSYIEDQQGAQERRTMKNLICIKATRRDRRIDKRGVWLSIAARAKCARPGVDAGVTCLDSSQRNEGLRL